MFVIQRLASANDQGCGWSGVSYREFSVKNCTECPIVDPNRGGIQMADCADNTCTCGNFPTQALSPVLLYYVDDQGDAPRCKSSWSTAPALYTAFSVVSASVMAYAAIHLFYIVVLSGMCSSERQKRFTKANTSALFFAIEQLFYLPVPLWLVSAQGELTVGNIGAEWLGYIFDILHMCREIPHNVGVTLLYISVFDTVYPMSNKRRCVIVSFWIITGVGILASVLEVVVHVSSSTHESQGFIVSLGILLAYLAQAVRGAFGIVIMILVHRRLHKVGLDASSLA